MYGPLWHELDVVRDTVLFPAMRTGDRVVFRNVGATTSRSGCSSSRTAPRWVLIDRAGATPHAQAENLETLLDRKSSVVVAALLHHAAPRRHEGACVDARNGCRTHAPVGGRRPLLPWGAVTRSCCSRVTGQRGRTPARHGRFSQAVRGGRALRAPRAGTARVLRLSPEQTRAGQLGYNALLVGLGVASILPLSAAAVDADRGGGRGGVLVTSVLHASVSVARGLPMLTAAVPRRVRAAAGAVNTSGLMHVARGARTCGPRGWSCLFSCAGTSRAWAPLVCLPRVDVG